MSYNGCPGNFPSCSLGCYLRCPGSFQPSNLVYSTDLCSPSTCLLEPIRFQTSRVVSFPCQSSCYHPRTSRLCSSCWTTYASCLGFNSSSLGCGSSVFRPLCYGVHGFPSLIYGSRFDYPTYLASRSFQSSGYRATYRSAFCRPTF
uniref:Keratin-associated protein n=1 Tax=Phocoena sinus TaxID=42100 RepID=A0A8C9CRS1_PHOSS